MSNNLISFPEIRCQNGALSTTSLAIAEAFGKNHKDVLRDIQGLECSEEFRRRNFAPSSYLNRQGKSQKQYSVSRDGFMLLCMGYTGARMMAVKEAYIEAFNSMEEQLTKYLPVLQKLAIASKPRWQKIARYKAMGLNNREVAKLLGIRPRLVGEELRQMEVCGLIAPPANLALMQKAGKRMLGGRHG